MLTCFTWPSRSPGVPRWSPRLAGPEADRRRFPLCARGAQRGARNQRAEEPPGRKRGCLRGAGVPQPSAPARPLPPTQACAPRSSATKVGPKFLGARRAGAQGRAEKGTAGSCSHDCLPYPGPCSAAAAAARGAGREAEAERGARGCGGAARQGARRGRGGRERARARGHVEPRSGRCRVLGDVTAQECPECGAAGAGRGLGARWAKVEVPHGGVGAFQSPP